MSCREGAQRRASAQNGTFWKTTSVLRLRWDFFGVDSSEASGLTSEHMDFVSGSEVDATQKNAWCNACIASATCQQMETPWRRICFIVLSKQPSHPIFTLQALPCIQRFFGQKEGCARWSRKRPPRVRGLEIHCKMETVSGGPGKRSKTVGTKQTVGTRPPLKKMTWQSARSRRKLKQLTWQSARSRRKNKQKTCDNQNYYIILKVFR